MDDDIELSGVRGPKYLNAAGKRVVVLARFNLSARTTYLGMVYTGHGPDDFEVDLYYQGELRRVDDDV